MSQSTHIVITNLSRYYLFFCFHFWISLNTIYSLQEQNFVHMTFLTVLSDLFLGKTWINTGWLHECHTLYKSISLPRHSLNIFIYFSTSYFLWAHHIARTQEWVQSTRAAMKLAQKLFLSFPWVTRITSGFFWIMIVETFICDLDELKTK